MTTKAPVSYYRLITVSDPAPGVEFALVAPGQGIWRVVSLAWRFVTAVAVADRNVNLVADDQTDIWLQSRSGVDQSAGLTGTYGAFAGAVPGGFPATLINLALPNDGLLLQPGHRLRTRTVNLQAADQFSLIRALVQEFPQGPVDEWLPTVDTQIYPMG